MSEKNSYRKTSPKKEQNQGLTPDKVKVYELLGNVIMKLLLVIATIVAFFIVLFYLINAKEGTEIAKYGVIDGVLGGVVVGVWRHYFPSKK